MVALEYSYSWIVPTGTDTLLQVKFFFCKPSSKIDPLESSASATLPEFRDEPNRKHQRGLQHSSVRRRGWTNTK